MQSGGMFHTNFLRSLGKDKRGVTAKDFDHFLHTLRIKLRGKHCVLIFDNAKIHHADELQPTLDDLRANHHIEVLYLPPYSPWITVLAIVTRGEARSATRAIATHAAPAR